MAERTNEVNSDNSKLKKFFTGGIIILILIIFLFFKVVFSFNSNTTCGTKGFKEITVSHDEKNIIFTYCDKQTSIYKADITGEHVKLLLKSKDGIYEYPIISPDGTKIAFIKRISKDSSFLYIMNSDGTDIKKLINQSANNILEIIYSNNGERIYFKNSGGTYHSSPIASSQPHDIDIYSLDIATNQIKRITNLNKYYWGGFAITPDNSKVYTDSYIINLKTLKTIEHNYIINKNLSYVWESPFSSGISFSQISLDGKYLIHSRGNHINGQISYHGLYLINLLNNSMEKEIIRGKNAYFDSPQFFNNDTQIIFINDKKAYGLGNRELWTIDIKGTNFQKLNITIP